MVFVVYLKFYILDVYLYWIPIFEICIDCVVFSACARVRWCCCVCVFWVLNMV